MDRNLTQRLNKLSQQLTNSLARLHSDELTEDERFELEGRIEDLQDEIWDIEDQLREEAEYEYEEHSAKGWN